MNTEMKVRINDERNEICKVVCFNTDCQNHAVHCGKDSTTCELKTIYLNRDGTCDWKPGEGNSDAAQKAFQKALDHFSQQPGAVTIRNGREASEIIKAQEKRIAMLEAENRELAEKYERITKLKLKSASAFRMAFDAKIVEAHQIASDHGWHDEPRNDGECLALIHSEISEALQALRDGNPADTHCPDYSALEVELADAVIRIMDYAHARSLDIAGAIIAKMGYNQTRPMRHGGKQF